MTGIKLHVQKGVGLIEIMIAIVISVFIMGAVIGVFLTNKENSILQRNMSSIQETARFAMHVLTQDLRMAGYAGCAPDIVDHLDASDPGYNDSMYNIKTAVAGWEFKNTEIRTTTEATPVTVDVTSIDPSTTSANDWTDYSGNALLTDLYTDGTTPRVVPNTDIIVIKQLAANLDIQMDNNTNITSTTLKTVTSPTGIDQGSILMVTEDCQSADLFQKTNNKLGADITKGTSAGFTPGNVNHTSIPGFSGGQKWSKLYTSAATLLTFRSTAYYIGIGDSGRPALFRATYNSVSTGIHEELIDGVENMQILYGEDTDSTEDGVANRWVAIDSVSDKLRIVAVRISLLIQSPELLHNMDVDTKTYLMTGLSNITSTIINPPDEKRLRIVTTETVKLRNKGVNL